MTFRIARFNPCSVPAALKNQIASVKAEHRKGSSRKRRRGSPTA